MFGPLCFCCDSSLAVTESPQGPSAYQALLTLDARSEKMISFRMPLPLLRAGDQKIGCHKCKIQLETSKFC